MSASVVVASVALGVWTAIVAIVSGWALVEPALRPWLSKVGARLRPWTALAPIAPDDARVLVLRPCAGRDANLQRNLRSIVDALSSFDRAKARCVFAVHDEEDPAYRECVAAKAWLETHEIECDVAVTRAVGPNHKVDQLARAQAMAQRDGAFSIVLVVDSDVDLTGASLAKLVEPLVAGTHAALWSPVPERGARPTLGDRASVAILSGGLHAFAILSRLDPAGMVGKLFAVRSDALASVGGFVALQRHLGEDVELSRRLRHARMRVGAEVLGALSSAEGRTMAATRDRYARWLLVVRAQRPMLLASYPMLFFAAPLQALASVALALVAPRVGLALLILIVCVRLTTAVAARRASRLPWSWRATLIDPWMGDVMLAFSWASALRLREVAWRGSKLRFDREGLLVAEERASEARASDARPSA
ncbi:MAG: glycosyltransferase [Myxococcales bacterium]|nr:glycosyltransferase [Myxococcales bacterium]